MRINCVNQRTLRHVDTPDVENAAHSAGLLRRAACAVAIAAFLLSVLVRTGGAADPPAAGELQKVKRLQPIAMADDREFPQKIQPFLTKFCADCHTGDEANAGLQFEKYPNKAAVLEHRKTWEKVFGMLQIGAMPPKDYDQPTADEMQAVVAWLDDALHNIDCNQVEDPGRVTIRRLNISEYNNTIRDLFGLDLRPAKDFPADDVGEGFDNIGDVLSLSPLLMEKYLKAAEEVANAVIVDTHTVPVVRKQGGDFKTEGSAQAGGDQVSFPSRGTATAKFDFPKKGEYILRVTAAATQAGDEPAKMEIKIDGKSVDVVSIKEHRRPELVELDVKVLKGKYDVSVTFLNDFYDPDNKDPERRDRNLLLNWIELEGPEGGVTIDPPEHHRRVVVATPSNRQDVERAARDVFAKLLPRVYRRPATDEEAARLAALVKQTVDEGGSYEDGLRLGLQAALVSPHFLFRVEQDPKPDDPNYKRQLKDYEIASRLSYFLWSSMPDEELFKLAEQRKLSQPTVLEAQVRRMLGDPKAAAFARNFGGQWLNLRNLDDIDFDRRRFRSFSNELRDDMREETLRFFEHVLREDRSVLDFINGPYTFVNQRLAEHYGLVGVEGEEFRQVYLDGYPRAGVLTQASILALTSNPTRTSPVKRGKWIMENILGTPPPPAPPNVPDLEQTAKASPEATLAEQLALHRQDPGCASCHNQMDPLGLAFEKFDAIGQYRERDGRKPVDDSGVLPGGRTFQGAPELIEILSERKRDFATNLTEKVLTYAIGRGLHYYDSCAVDHIVDALEKDEYRFSRLIVEVVKSDPFLLKRGDGGIE